MAKLPTRPLTPLDFAFILREHDPEKEQDPEADFWRKGKPGKWVTPPIIRHSGVQQLARLFGVEIVRPDPQRPWYIVGDAYWPVWEPKELALTAIVTVRGYKPQSKEQCGYDLAPEYPVPDYTTQIGEVNTANAGTVGRDYPICFAYNRAYDRAILDHLGLFRHYGDTESPRFALGADYEAPLEYPSPQRGGLGGSAEVPPSAQPQVTTAQWNRLCKTHPAIRPLLARLKPKVGLERLNRIYVDCGGQAEDMIRALEELEGKLIPQAPGGKVHQALLDIMPEGAVGGES